MNALSRSDTPEELSSSKKAVPATSSSSPASVEPSSGPRAASGGEQAELPVELPQVQEGELNEEEVTKYLSDVSGGAQRVTVRVKDSARAQMRALDKLAELHRLVLQKKVWGAQIRYEFEDAEWTDTLIVTQSGTRIVRVRHQSR